MDTFFDTKHLYRSYFKAAFPVVMGLVVTLIYNLADTYFIARTDNIDLIAGVSLCSPVFTALMAFGNIYGQGGSSLISRLLGTDNQESVKRISSFCFYAALFTGIIIAVTMSAFNRSILTLLGADKKTMQYAFDHYIILVIFAPIMVLSFIHSSLVRCEGMSVESMFGTIMGALINIVLDPILISVVGMGAMGAAIATVSGYFCSVLYFLFLIFKKSHCLSVNVTLCRISRAEFKQIVGIGITAALSNLMQSLCIVLVNHFLLPYGNDKIAAMGVVLKINMIAQLVLTGFAFGGIPLFGYLYGARKAHETQRLIRFCIIFITALSFVLTIVLCVFTAPLAGLFIKDSSVAAVGIEMLRLQAVSTVFAGLVLLLTVLFQAAGKVIPSFILSVSRQGIVFAAVLVISAKFFDYAGVLASQAVSDVISAVMAAVLFAVCNPVRRNDSDS